jgi:hypothetical protein
MEGNEVAEFTLRLGTTTKRHYENQDLYQGFPVDGYWGVDVTPGHGNSDSFPDRKKTSRATCIQGKADGFSGQDALKSGISVGG